MVEKQANVRENTALLQQAIVHHQAGRLQHAEHIYNRIIAVEQDNANAYHFPGVIAHQTGKNIGPNFGRLHLLLLQLGFLRRAAFSLLGRSFQPGADEWHQHLVLRQATMPAQERNPGPEWLQCVIAVG